MDEIKWLGYVLADEGHGREWRRVFQAEAHQADALWQAIASLAVSAPVTDLRPGSRGMGCAVHAALTFGERTAHVVLAWLYDEPDDRPRLVSAYPSP
ncbi:MAG: hypothetical protein JO321_15540 [Solirubrobacterales bacterium]|nr:hypothetical protein [Solirubrobacterales bacterium]MBV9536815.1 hypothetical protein [Solirubrobacterales bacterium]